MKQTNKKKWQISNSRSWFCALDLEPEGPHWFSCMSGIKKKKNIKNVVTARLGSVYSALSLKFR